MVKQIKNRIAAFEEMAATTKRTSKILKIEPTSPGFSAVPSMKNSVRAKETSGVVDNGWKPRKNKTTSEDEPLQGELQSAMNLTYEKFKMRRSYRATDEVDNQPETKQDTYRDEDDAGYGDGPVNIIKVRSKERQRNDGNQEDGHDYRDEQSISPLSFLEYHGDYRHENTGKIDPKFTPIDEGTDAENRHRETEADLDLSPFHMKNSRSTPENHDPSFLTYKSIESSLVRPNASKPTIHKDSGGHPNGESTKVEASNNDVKVVEELDNVLMTYVLGPDMDDTGKSPVNGNVDDGAPPPPPPRNVFSSDEHHDDRDRNSDNHVNPVENAEHLRDAADDQIDQTEDVKQVQNIISSDIVPNENPNHNIDATGEHNIHSSHSHGSQSHGSQSHGSHSHGLHGSHSHGSHSHGSRSHGLHGSHSHGSHSHDSHHSYDDHVDQTHQTPFKREEIITSEMLLSESINREQIMNESHIDQIERVKHAQRNEDDNIDDGSNSHTHHSSEHSQEKDRDFGDDRSEPKPTASEDYSDTSLVGAGIEVEGTPSAEHSIGPDDEMMHTPHSQHFHEDDIQDEAGEEVFYGEAITLPHDSMHEVYHSTLEEYGEDDRSQDMSAFEKGYQREIDAMDMAQSAMKQQSHNPDVVSPLRREYDDDNDGYGGREGNFQIFPRTLEPSRNDDAESLGVSVLTEDDYGYEVKIRQRKVTEVVDVDTLHGDSVSSNRENEEIHSQTHGRGSDHGTVSSIKNNRGTTIYRAASPLALNPNIKRMHHMPMMAGGQSINDDSERQKNSSLSITKKGKGMKNISGSVASRSSKGSGSGQSDYTRNSGLSTVDTPNIDYRDSRKLRKKRSVSSKLRRSLSPFRKNSEKNISTNNSDHGSQISRQMSAANSTDNTATIDNRKSTKTKKSFASRLKNASPFRRRNSKNKIPHHGRSFASADESSVASSRIGASPRRGEHEIMREVMNGDYDTSNEMSLLVENAGHEI